MKPYSKMSPGERHQISNGDQLSWSAQARRHAPAAVAELVRIIKNTPSDAARVAAISVLLERGLGKPPKPLDIAIRDRVKPPPPISSEQAAELFRRLRMKLLSNDGLGETDLEVLLTNAPNP